MGTELAAPWLHSATKTTRQDTETPEATGKPTAGQSSSDGEPEITQARLQEVTATYLQR